MPVLIDNYSVPKQSNSASLFLQMPCTNTTFLSQFAASITIFSSSIYNINARIIGLLNEYALLKENWDEEGGISPSSSAIRLAKYITSVLEKHGQPIFHVAPGPNGEIMLDIRNKSKNKSIEIIFYNDRSVVVCFPEQGKPFQKAFETKQLPELVEWLNQK